MRLPSLHTISAVLGLLLYAASPRLFADTWTLPDGKDPVAGMGVNIHFDDAKPGELEMLSQAGFHWIRQDLVWAQTEKQAGVYDFSAQDRLLASLDQFHLRALLILDYTNPLYDGGKPTCSEAGRQAFANWAVAAVTHFQGRGIIWEIWNEPDGEWFWKPKPNAEDYAKLAVTVSKAIHEAAPDEFVVGPAFSVGLPWPWPPRLNFLDVVAGSGVLNYWPAITIHPYLQTGPETYGSVYAKCREIIGKHLAAGQKVDLYCGESGYTEAWPGIDQATQGKYLARLFLFNVLSDVPLTIWYDWHDDGPNPKDGEQRYGTVHYDYHAGATPVYDPKPAYLAAQTYSRQLTGYQFKERVKLGSDHDYLLSFTQDAGECLVAWTTAPTPHPVKIPAPDGDYTVTSYDGKTQTQVQAMDGSLSLTLDGGPQYLKRQ
jgi:hypothetical protein